MKSLFTRIKQIFPLKGRFARSAAVLSGGALTAQAIGFLSSVVLTRLYLPSDFGVLTAYTALLSIMSVGAALRYEIAIPLASDNKEAINLTFLSMTLVVIVSGLSMILVACWGTSIVAALGVESLGPFLWMIPLGLLAMGFQQMLSFWASYRELFTALARFRFYQALGQLLLQSALFSFREWGLLFGFVLSRLAGIFVFVKDLISFFGHVSIKSWPKLAWKYRSFPQFNLWGALLDTIGLQITPLLFARFFTPEVTGWYGMAMRVTALPSSLIGQAIGQVFYPEASRLKGDPESLSRLVASTARVLIKLAIPTFVFLFFSAPILFSIVFGEHWREAGEYARYLSIWLLLNFVSSPLSIIVLVAGKQKTAFFFTVYETILRVLGVWAGAVLGSPRLSVLFYALAGLLISLIYNAWVFHLSGIKLWSWFKADRIYVVQILVLSIGLWILQFFLSEWTMIGLAFLGSGVILLIGWKDIRGFIDG